MYAVVVEFIVHPQHQEDFLRAVLANARTSLSQEAGCKRFDVCRATEEPGRVLLYELYADSAAFQAHLQTPHFLEFESSSKPWVCTKRVSFWELLD